MTQSVIATTPGAMVEAKGKLIGWIDLKLAACEEERRTAEALLVQLRLARSATTHADRILDSCRRRERFYEKVRAALEAGYYIIPPFDCQVFAIRTDRVKPPENVSRIRNPQNDARVPALPAGKGDYTNPVPAREYLCDETVRRGDKDVQENVYANTAWRDVEFPVRAMKPELIEATRGAMEAMIFDAFAIAPQYRAADPIIVGQIRHYKSNRLPLTFFVAWWLDEKDL